MKTIKTKLQVFSGYYEYREINEILEKIETAKGKDKKLLKGNLATAIKKLHPSTAHEIQAQFDALAELTGAVYEEPAKDNVKADADIDVNVDADIDVNVDAETDVKADAVYEEPAKDNVKVDAEIDAQDEIEDAAKTA